MQHAAENPNVAEMVVADHCHLRIDSSPEWISRIVDFLIQRATQCGVVHPGRANRLMIALHEALTNSVIHGNLNISSKLKEQSDQAFAEAVAARCADPAFAGRVVDIQASFNGKAGRWAFTDQGAGFDVDTALQRLEIEDPDPSRPSGRGLFLIRAFVDEMRFDDRGRRLTLTLNRTVAGEKRATTRFPVTQGVRIAPIDGEGRVDWDGSQDAMARDLSLQGISLLQSHLSGSKHVLITIPTAGEPILLQAEVRRWQQVGDMVEVGCRFEAPGSLLPAGDSPADATAENPLSKLLDRLSDQLKPLEERRISQRLAYTETISVAAADHPPVPGFGRDLSRTGIAFFTTTSLPLGMVRLALPAGESAPAITIQAQVVRCTRLMDGFYDVGAQFLPE